MTPEQRALVDGARERASKAGAYLDSLASDEGDEPTHEELLEACDTLGSHTAAIRFYVPALCDLADEQEKQIVILREGLDIVRSLRDHMSKLYDEAKARIAELEASVALLDSEGRKMKEQRDEGRHRVQVLLDEIAEFAVATGMMNPEMRSALDGPNAIQFLRMGAIRIQGHETVREERDADRAAEDAATKSAAELRAVAFVPPIEREEGALVIFLPSIQVAISAGFNGFAFELAAETYARALPRIPEGRPVVARVNAKGTMIDVEVRRAPS